MFNFSVVGADGKVGSILCNKIQNNNKLNLLYRVVSSKHLQSKSLEVQQKYSYTSDLTKVFKDSDIIIDFSSTSCMEECLKLATKHTTTLLTGVTGYDDEYIKTLSKQASHVSKICISSNTSFAVNFIRYIIQKNVSQLSQYDAEIHEKHHNKKTDAISGTALTFAQDALHNSNHINKITTNRSGVRQKDEIGISSSRGGAVFGDHTINFFGENDEISINHTAYNRELFADGAIDLAQKLYNKKEKNGIFDTIDLFNFQNAC